MSRTFRHRISVGVLVVLGPFLASCNEAGPGTLALEADAPVVSDLALPSGERVRFNRSDGGALSYQTPSLHAQQFEPIAGATLNDVLAEAEAAITAAGWELKPEQETDFKCAVRDRASGAKMSVRVGISDDDYGSQVLDPFVFVTLNHRDRCR